MSGNGLLLGRIAAAVCQNLVVHGHAHHGTLEGQTLAGVPVRNVAITLLQAQSPPSAYRVFDI
jgi:hypothetical protein